MALLFDEVNILGDIAFKIIKGQYRFFGFIDAESHPSELYVDTQKEISHADYVKKQVATHALVFQVAELGGEAFPSRLRQVVGMHAVTNLNAVTLNGLFWRTVRNLYLLAGVTIVVNISDGASCNRLFQKMNTHPTDSAKAQATSISPVRRGVLTLTSLALRLKCGSCPIRLTGSKRW